MQPTEDVKRLRGQKLDKAVLKYLREMIGVCRRFNRRELVWEYQHAWEFAATIIYGPLPPRPDYSTGHHPSTVATQFPSGFTRPEKMPLRKIVKRFTRPYRSWEIRYETLECAHILMAPAGYSVSVKSRRCPHCAIAAALAKKKPSSAAAPRSKAVSA
jgi:hypothetical protein